MQRKTIIFGIDGAILKLIKSWTKEGRLPTFKKIFDNGVYGNLKSSEPPISCPAWPCIYSGVGSKKMGVFHFKKFNVKKKIFNLSTRKEIDLRYFWEDFNLNNLKFVGLNLQVTHPPKKEDNVIITGLIGPPGPKINFSYPSNLKKELRKFCNFKFSDIQISKKQPLNPLKSNGVKATKRLFKVYKYLLEHKKWNLLFVIFEWVDISQHLFWKAYKEKTRQNKEQFKNVIYEAYKLMDEFLKYTINKYDKKINLFVVSDHGGGELKGLIMINNILIKKGLLKLKKERKNIRNILGKIGLTSNKFESIANYLKINNYIGLMPRKMLYFLKYKNNKGSFEEYLLNDLIDWKNTVAFSPVGEVIYINKDIIKKLDDYERIRNRIIDILVEKFGERIKYVLSITKKEEGGDEEYPDIIVNGCELGMESSDYISDDLREKDKDRRGFTGTHKRNGIFMAYGPDIKQGITNDARVIDIAPTIRWMFNLPINNNIDGVVLKGIFNKKSLKKQ